MNSPLLYYVGGGAVIAITAASMLYLLLRIVGFNRRGTQAPGTVVAGNWQGDGSGGSVCFPVVAFTASDGQQYVFSANVGTNFPPKVGSPVTVLYDPANPQKAEIKSFTGVWLTLFFYGAFGVAGIGMLVFSILSYAHTEPSSFGGGVAYLGAFIPFLMGCVFGLVAAGLSFVNARSI